MNRITGKRIEASDHIRQSIIDIVTTPVGTRVMRRDYGSHIFDLVDAPGNAVGTLRMVAATADALARWEPRGVLQRGRLATGADGRAALGLDLVTTAAASPLSAEVPVAGLWGVTA